MSNTDNDQRRRIVAIAVQRILMEPRVLRMINEELGGALDNVLKGEGQPIKYLFEKNLVALGSIDAEDGKLSIRLVVDSVEDET